MSKYYAVRQGRENGIFNDWSRCEASIKKYAGASFKSFKTVMEAIEYIIANDTYSAYMIPYYANEKDNSKYAYAFALYYNGVCELFKRNFLLINIVTENPLKTRTIEELDAIEAAISEAVGLKIKKLVVFYNHPCVKY